MSAPASEEELVSRAHRLAGRVLTSVAAAHELEVPAALARNKGWVGALIERALGATAGSRAAPDFEALGVELKTVPLSVRGRPRESTFLGSIDPRALVEEPWARSSARKKLARVLWVPVEAAPTIPLGERRIGRALLWSPSASEEAELAEDYESLRAAASEGWLDGVTAHLGRHLQVRPKARDASARRWTPDADGHESLALPRGFYLRARFVARILERNYHPASTRPAGLTRRVNTVSEGST